SANGNDGSAVRTPNRAWRTAKSWPGLGTLVVIPVTETDGTNPDPEPVQAAEMGGVKSHIPANGEAATCTVRMATADAPAPLVTTRVKIVVLTSGPTVTTAPERMGSTTSSCVRLPAPPVNSAVMFAKPPDVTGLGCPVKDRIVGRDGATVTVTTAATVVPTTLVTASVKVVVLVK